MILWIIFFCTLKFFCTVSATVILNFTVCSRYSYIMKWWFCSIGEPTPMRSSWWCPRWPAAHHTSSPSWAPGQYPSPVLILYQQSVRNTEECMIMWSAVTDPTTSSIQHDILSAGHFGGSGSVGSICFWTSRIWIHLSEIWIRIRILLSSSKNSKKNIDCYCFVTCFWLFISKIQKVISKKKLGNFLLTSWRSLTKITGSGYEYGSLVRGLDPWIRIRTKISWIRWQISQSEERVIFNFLYNWFPL